MCKLIAFPRTGKMITTDAYKNDGESVKPDTIERSVDLQKVAMVHRLVARQLLHKTTGCMSYYWSGKRMPHQLMQSFTRHWWLKTRAFQAIIADNPTRPKMGYSRK